MSRSSVYPAPIASPTGDRAKTLSRPERERRRGERFRRACELAGFSFSQVALYVGVADSQILAIASGARALTEERIESLPIAVKREYVRLLSETVADDFDGAVAGDAAIDAIERQLPRMLRDVSEFAVQVTDATADGVITEAERKALVKAGVTAARGLRTTLLRLVGKRTG